MRNDECDNYNPTPAIVAGVAAATLIVIVVVIVCIVTCVIVIKKRNPRKQAKYFMLMLKRCTKKLIIQMMVRQDRAIAKVPSSMKMQQCGDWKQIKEIYRKKELLITQPNQAVSVMTDLP